MFWLEHNKRSFREIDLSLFPRGHHLSEVFGRITFGANYKPGHNVNWTKHVTFRPSIFVLIEASYPLIIGKYTNYQYKTTVKTNH